MSLSLYFFLIFVKFKYKYVLIHLFFISILEIQSVSFKIKIKESFYYFCNQIAFWFSNKILDHATKLKILIGFHKLSEICVIFRIAVMKKK